jgi:DNA-binding MarR family transcriptional regulator
VLRTADALLRDSEQILKPAALSNTQYNVLRILRGAGAQGLACREIADRMITRDPDITRLLDRLESRGLVFRTREREDRRVVKTRITSEGLRILRELDEPMRQLHRRQVQHISHRRLRLLVQLLSEVRQAVSEERD